MGVQMVKARQGLCKQPVAALLRYLPNVQTMYVLHQNPFGLPSKDQVELRPEKSQTLTNPKCPKFPTDFGSPDIENFANSDLPGDLHHHKLLFLQRGPLGHLQLDSGSESVGSSLDFRHGRLIARCTRGRLGPRWSQKLSASLGLLLLFFVQGSQKEPKQFGCFFFG